MNRDDLEIKMLCDLTLAMYIDPAWHKSECLLDLMQAIFATREALCRTIADRFLFSCLFIWFWRISSSTLHKLCHDYHCHIFFFQAELLFQKLLITSVHKNVERVCVFVCACERVCSLDKIIY